MYSIKDYNYDLPEALIAQTPCQKRENSRLLHLNRQSGEVSHHHFHDIVSMLKPDDVLVVNDTKVIPGRLLGRKSSGGKIEALLLDYASGTLALNEKNGVQERTQRCLIKSSKKPRIGSWLDFTEDLRAQVLDWRDGIATLKFICRKDFTTILQQIGKIPLPPYIKRDTNAGEQQRKDRAAYQTVYAAHPGAIAAPTAGLHFSHDILEHLALKGINVVSITLHVGYGTFVPVRVSDIRDHVMHAEYYTISEDTATCLNRAKQNGRRIIAVGTTSVRTLEYHSDDQGMLASGSGSCNLFIYPGYRFKVIDGLITNFHLPCSTLLMLVSALAGREYILAAYQSAVDAGYRFFSYGDAMLIL